MGGSFTVGKGSLFTVSCKQEITTNSSTEVAMVVIVSLLYGTYHGNQKIILLYGGNILILQDNEIIFL